MVGPECLARHVVVSSLDLYLIQMSLLRNPGQYGNPLLKDPASVSDGDLLVVE